MANIKIKNLILCLVLAILAFAVYANSFKNQMFWDDNDFILNNQFVKNFELKNIFTNNVIAGAQLDSNYYRPVLSTVFALEWQGWQDKVVGWHAVNTTFHALDGILLFFILFYVFQKRWLAFFTAAIFVVHPLQTEAVTYVNSLGDSLSVFFMFLGILLHLQSRYVTAKAYRSWKYWAAILMYPLALLSKETAVIMPALLFLGDFFAQITTEKNHNIKSSLRSKLWSAFKFIWPYFVLAGAYVLLRATSLNFIDSFNLYGGTNYFTSHILARIFTFLKTLVIYFGLIFWPAHQHMERTLQFSTSLLEPQVLFGLAIFATLIFAAFALYKKYPELSFGAWWFLIAISPVSNIAVPINGLIYEHWLYVPLIGIALGVVWLGTRIVCRVQSPAWHETARASAVGIFCLTAIALSTKTIIRNNDWHDPITFYNQVIQYAPDSYRIINNLGMAYADAYQIPKAEEMYTRAISLDPSNPVAYHNLANAYEALGQYDLAEQNFKKALSLDSNFIFSVNGLVKLYLYENRITAAQELAGRYGLQVPTGQ